MKMEISKTKIEKRLRQKKNPELVNTLIQLKKKNADAARALAKPVKKQLNLNLSELNEILEDGKKYFLSGKVLSTGSLEKKVKLVAWSASKGALEKMKKSNVEFVLLTEEIKKNPELKELEILR
jgi:large subunit ribosomal protein L18e